MAKRDKKKAGKSADPRVEATSEIGSYLIAGLAICIPLVAILKSPLIVVVVVGGAALAIAGIWRSGNSKEVESKSKRIADLESTIEDLKERLENVEVINRYETTLAERALEAEEIDQPKSMGPTAES